MVSTRSDLQWHRSTLQFNFNFNTDLVYSKTIQKLFPFFREKFIIFKWKVNKRRENIYIAYLCYFIRVKVINCFQITTFLNLIIFGHICPPFFPPGKVERKRYQYLLSIITILLSFFLFIFSLSLSIICYFLLYFTFNYILLFIYSRRVSSLHFFPIFIIISMETARIVNQHSSGRVNSRSR